MFLYLLQHIKQKPGTKAGFILTRKIISHTSMCYLFYTFTIRIIITDYYWKHSQNC